MTVAEVHALIQSPEYRAERSSSRQPAYLLRDICGRTVASLAELPSGRMMVAYDDESRYRLSGCFNAETIFDGAEADTLRTVFDRLKENER